MRYYGKLCLSAKGQKPVLIYQNPKDRNQAFRFVVKNERKDGSTNRYCSVCKGIQNQRKNNDKTANNKVISIVCRGKEFTQDPLSIHHLCIENGKTLTMMKAKADDYRRNIAQEIRENPTSRGDDVKTTKDLMRANCKNKKEFEIMSLFLPDAKLLKWNFQKLANRAHRRAENASDSDS
uniref:Uncharacterized protein n=1 Tax=Panagrolaimus sp. JU765 TaxID=591449 RepID=A0AC34RGI8_9BILA